MFETLTERLNGLFRRLTGGGRLSEKDIEEALREVRLALLEADVNLRVARDFTARVREQALAAEILESLTPGQQVVKIVHAEMVSLLGETTALLTSSFQPPSVVMLVGLQGSGKTTTTAKLALHLKKQGQRPLLMSADPYRPAAVEQLAVLGSQLDIPVVEGSGLPLEMAPKALDQAQQGGHHWLLVDTAGRLHIDEQMMAEVRGLSQALSPAEVLLVVDAMTGQDGVRVAEEFHNQMGLTGFILTKLDGDARGGVALSVRAVTGVPIKFVGIGEKAEALEPFHPDRMASRILGMGDVLTLIEKAEEAFDEKQAMEMEKKVRSGELTLEDFLGQLQQLKKMGPLPQLMEMVPGMSGMMNKLPPMDEGKLKRVEAIIFSMTLEERQHPQIIGGSRRRRIARGSGTQPQEVNQLLNQFSQMQKLMKQVQKGRGLLKLFG
ncbi:MAG: signal recognition particle protein [Dehalococcoidia bacterium]|nr:signal recognition particle protein [Dehalococcoidia bacterium]MDP7469803.1 signal recognition particle protein [Dehalococcoidia bacterium]